MKRRPKEKQGIVPDLLIGTTLFELKGIHSDSTHTNHNGARRRAVVTGVENREINIPLVIQKQAVKLNEDIFYVWLRRRWGRGSSGSTSSGGVKSLAFGQYGELGPGLEELLDTTAAGASETADERYLINRHLADISRGAAEKPKRENDVDLRQRR